MQQEMHNSREQFLKSYTSCVHKWALYKSVLLALGVMLSSFALLFIFMGRDALGAISITFAFVSFFVFHSLSYTMREMLLMKAMESKSVLEPYFDLEKEEELYTCIEQYELMAKEARKEAFHYESDINGFSIKKFFYRLQRFFGWKGFHLLEEVCLLATIDLFIKEVRAMPCDVTLHARLANGYILLQQHYVEPMEAKKLMLAPTLCLSRKEQDQLEKKAKQAATLALEELEVMSEYAPDELWVHEQLAISYRELGLKQEELKECEKLLQLHPDDEQLLLRLGTLYFQTGQHGKGLRMYGQLKELDSLLAHELIAQYGSFSPFLQIETDSTN